MSIRTLSLVLVLMVLAASGGMHLGGHFERQSAERERGVVAEAPRVSTAALPTLRCGTNQRTGEPVVWSQVDAESKIHLAQVALDTALANSWNPKFRDWTVFAQAVLDLVDTCWGGEKP